MGLDILFTWTISENHLVSLESSFRVILEPIEQLAGERQRPRPLKTILLSAHEIVVRVLSLDSWFEFALRCLVVLVITFFSSLASQHPAQIWLRWCSSKRMDFLQLSL